MPALREWDIDALESACGRNFAPGRLQKLDRAGLLGGGANADDNDGDHIMQREEVSEEEVLQEQEEEEDKWSYCLSYTWFQVLSY